MYVALGGHDADNPSDPLVIVPQILDVPRLVGPIEQHRLEDLQLFGFLTVLAAAGADYPVAVEVPEHDPPDRVLICRGSKWGTELTELTLQDLRSELGPIRAAGRRLQAELRASGVHEHLRGRVVSAFVKEPQSFPKDIEPHINAAVEALQVDKGSFNDIQFDLSHGPPKQLPIHVGTYGQVGPFLLDLNGPPGPPGEILVATNVGARFHQSDVLSALRKRVEEKDTPGNELLLITCGLPDKQGYDCAGDAFIYELLAEALREDPALFDISPQYIDAVALHSWHTQQWIEVYRRAGASSIWPSSKA